ncbi:MAG: hypothetical protein ACYDHN_11195 [Solirubrobacteraceae bacterium]
MRSAVVCSMISMVAILAGVGAGSALALPVLLLLPGETGSVLFESLANTFTVRLENELEAIEGEGGSLKLHFPNSTNNLGTFELGFSKVIVPILGIPCHTTGDAEGEVLVPRGEVHLVFDSLGSSLGVAALLLINEFPITCSTTVLKTRGMALVLLKPLNTEVLTTQELSAKLRCVVGGPGKAEDKTWWNATGALQTAQLLSKFKEGFPFEESCFDIENELKLKPKRMVELMG